MSVESALTPLALWQLEWRIVSHISPGMSYCWWGGVGSGCPWLVVGRAYKLWTMLMLLLSIIDGCHWSCGTRSVYGYFELVAVGCLLCCFDLVVYRRSFIIRVSFAPHCVGMQVFDISWLQVEDSFVDDFVDGFISIMSIGCWCEENHYLSNNHQNGVEFIIWGW